MLQFDADDEFIQTKLRKERLWESKRHAHEAVEVFFRAMVLSMEAIWGGIKEPENSGEQTDNELKEAA